MVSRHAKDQDCLKSMQFMKCIKPLIKKERKKYYWIIAYYYYITYYLTNNFVQDHDYVHM